ncbi:hypothetical protein [Salinimicrobium gaetbulicola]|uniref:Uncharacterized protein n=1 Tax=Salinimicrobium gaetbulicola TaxID=999702 RepID=A0ABW3IHL6_9FLAO
MKEPFLYGQAILFLSPLLMFIIAVAFRLLDNSAYLFLQKEIIINSSYISVRLLRLHAQRTHDPKFARQLRRMLLYRKLHRLFLYLMIPASVFTIYYGRLLF